MEVWVNNTFDLLCPLMDYCSLYISMLRKPALLGRSRASADPRFACTLLE